VYGPWSQGTGVSLRPASVSRLYVTTPRAGCVCLGASSGRSKVRSHVRYSPVCRVRSFAGQAHIFKKKETAI